MPKDNADYFITGTDTDVGKTYIAAALIKHFANQGVRVVGMKPVASGGRFVSGRFEHPDVKALLEASNVSAEQTMMNPYRFEPAIAPHIAAYRAGVEISLDKIEESFMGLKKQADRVIVEGAGGFRVPLNQSETMADIAYRLKLPIILVVGIRLGCINHALMTAGSIRAKGLQMVGWVANRIDPNMEVADENVETLKLMLEAPLIADVGLNEIPHFQHL
jgi:dethiobiotin synthetase